MLRFIVRRVFWSIPVLISITLLVFLIIHAIPGSPWNREGARALPNQGMDDTTAQALDRRYGLSLPLWRQYVRFILGDIEADGRFTCGAICLNFGPSLRQPGRTVQDVLFSVPEGGDPLTSRFWYSMRLVGLAFAFAILAGVPLGVVSAAKHGSRFDFAAGILGAIGMSVPNFVIALILLIVLASWLHLINIVATTWTDPRAWIAPAVALGLGTAGATARLTRNATLEAMNRDYVRTARGKGLGEFAVVVVHILKNALIPVITFLGPAWAELVAASFIVEQMFGFPGLGREFVDSILRRDYPMILAATLLYAVMIMLANLVVDMLYGAIDPRVRLEH